MRIGFIGTCDCYDIILYLSRILYHLGKKVFLADFDGRLASAIPQPEGMGKKGVVEYHGILFSEGEPKEEGYDVILYHLGQKKEGLRHCDIITYCTDQQLPAVNFLQEVPRYHKQEQLLIRDVLDCGISAEYVKQHSQIVTDATYVIFWDEIDTKRKIRCQYDDFFSFRGLSSGIRQYLHDTVKLLCPERTEKEYQAAYKKAERGK